MILLKSWDQTTRTACLGVPVRGGVFNTRLSEPLQSRTDRGTFTIGTMGDKRSLVGNLDQFNKISTRVPVRRRGRAGGIGLDKQDSESLCLSLSPSRLSLLENHQNQASESGTLGSAAGSTLGVLRQDHYITVSSGSAPWLLFEPCPMRMQAAP